uniref:DENN domain-containing protein 11 n=1 Tax=Ciona intestinalis TaxID=7719 RepID=F7AB27_CIOIN|nr:protein LCHN-like [Ciona intestinalis]|eukprot:XP_002127536.1 protein LCHN-like [Ciona intestinalis]
MDEEESKPLLLDDGNDTFNSNNQKKSVFGKRKNKIGVVDTFNSIDLLFNQTEAEEEPDYIVSVFVVTFDTRCGNMVEWSTPSELDLSSIEFKAMPSGAHTVESDFIYFRLNNLFGLSCFEKMRVNSVEERGARMKSVGILASTYTTLFRHMQFLEMQVRHHLQTPGNYLQLEEFYKDRHGVLPPLVQQPSNANHIKNTNQFPHMKITHPAGCFSQFIKFFGENIFVLWKLVLLGKRILFFSPPPIGVVCYRVYCACCLGKVAVNGFEHKTPKPYFYINVADIEDVENELNYIACTTERIFREKSRLYDIYVDNQVIVSTDVQSKDLLKVNKVDKEKYQNLLNHRNDLLFHQEIGDDNVPTEEEVYQSYFIHQNNQLFETLMEAASSRDKTLTEDHIKAMGLDPVGDRHFIMDLLELYAIDVMLVVDNPCCPV